MFIFQGSFFKQCMVDQVLLKKCCVGVRNLAGLLCKEGLLTSVLTSEKIVKKELEQGHLCVWLDRSKEVIGFVHFRCKSNLCVVIYEIGVSSFYRSKGYGSRLLKFILKKLKPTTVTAKCSIRNKTAINFWLRNGFDIIDFEKRYNRKKKRDSFYLLFCKIL